MKNLVKWVGIIVLCLVLYALPVLVTIGICEGWLGWLAGVSFILVIWVVSEFLFLVSIIEKRYLNDNRKNYKSRRFGAATD